ncbi:MAG: ferritin-like domain-containing protein [Jatrophihabitantaceae bacterium]
MTAPGQDAVTQALQRVLAAQHAAVFGYPVIGVELRDPGQVQLARQLEARHRNTRDELMAQLAARRVSPTPAEASYTPAQPVTAPADAQRWALELEQDCAAAYRYLLVAPVLTVASDGNPSLNASPQNGSSSSGANGSAANGGGAAGAGEQASLRRQALTGLNTAALNATEWRSLLSPATPTVAFPGL